MGANSVKTSLARILVLSPVPLFFLTGVAQDVQGPFRRVLRYFTTLTGSGTLHTSIRPAASL
jgi:hypothetical protein